MQKGRPPSLPFEVRNECCYLPGLAGAEIGALPFTPEKTEWPVPEERRYRMVSESEVIMKSAAAQLVILVSRLAAARGPKAVCDPWPPNVPARSALLPCCSRTTPMRKKHTMMWMTMTE